MNNDLEHPQSALLTESLTPRLRELHPDGRFFVGEDVGIYYRYDAGDPLRGCKSPDWYYVPGVAGAGNGSRGSYVLWRERVPPTIVIEYVSNDEGEEWDRTPNTGKFWVYERAIGAAYYAIFDPRESRLEVYERVDDRYRPMTADANGRFVVPPLGVALGMWDGVFRGYSITWLRAWDDGSGVILPNSAEREAASEQRAEKAEGAIDHHRELLADERVISAEKAKAAEEAIARARNAEEKAEQERAKAEQERAKAEQERAKTEQERAKAEQERAKAEEAIAKAARLAERLRALGIDPEAA